MLRKLLASTAAVLAAGTLALAANLAPFPGPIDPSNQLAHFNFLIGKINTGVSGLIGFLPGPINSVAQTAEQSLASTTIPGGTLATPGQSVRLYCAGTTASNGNNKTVKLYFGQTVISTATMSTSAETWELELIVSNASNTQPNSVAMGRGTTNTTVVAPIATNNTSDSMAASQVAKCTTTQGNASAADTVLQTFLVEQVK